LLLCVLAGEALCDSEKVESLAHSHLAAIEAIAAPQRQNAVLPGAKIFRCGAARIISGGWSTIFG
jgi:hypothetical protein